MNNRHVPLDIKPQWLNVIRRIQSVARRNEGVGIIQIKVMVNQEGIPLFWIEPEMILLEPKSTVSIDLLRKELTDDQFSHLLQYIFNQ